MLGDLEVNRIGLGAMRLTGDAAFDLGRPSDRERSIRVLRRAVELGVDHIDTAAFYFSSLRSANELINTALSPYPDDLVIATKVWPGRDSSGEWWWATPAQLRGQVEENLRQLGRDHLDLVNLRIPRRRVDSIGEHFAVLADLRDAGLIRHLGISNATADHLAEAQAIAPVVCVQNEYGIGAPSEAQALLRTCGEQGVAFVPFFTIAGRGREAGAAVTGEDTRVRAVARAHGATTAQVRLAWALHQGQHVLVIPGTGDPDHLVENIAAGSLRLSDEEVAHLSSPTPGDR
ncbi:aldo/keto reductase [Actinoallomurus soli]|uniref:aldo/keto reductase n=1 Tax=Actinoallomurus soli TaxID=2952535 RepID=UPI002092C7F1|nr:aldo/keto reductase [Actinoallomurus soli]MCO5970216.1 aldo/keto reductase [Actinoallomurus soli]